MAISLQSGGQHDATTPSATADPLSSMLRSELSSVRARADQIMHQVFLNPDNLEEVKYLIPNTVLIGNSEATGLRHGG